MAQFLHSTFDLFVDRPGVFDKLEMKWRKVFAGTGQTGRLIMKRGMRRRKKPSPADGQSFPHAHAGWLRELIFFNYDPVEKELIIGPIRFDKQPRWLPAGIETVPQLINQGGQYTITDNGVPETINYVKRPYVELSRPQTVAKWLELVRKYT